MTKREHRGKKAIGRSENLERGGGFSWELRCNSEKKCELISDLVHSTVGINPRLSDLKGPGTSKLDWRYLDHDEIDRNKLQIRTN